MTGHPDLVDEQRHLDYAYACLRAMRERTERAAVLADSAATAVDSALAQRHLHRRLASLDADVAALTFGRLDSEADETFYVGRRHVEDDGGDPVVVDWRARVATPFYRATVRDPMDLRRRRRFSVTGREIVAIHDEVFDDPDSVALAGGIPDPLLAELERARTGEMRDIVATIQAEQDVVIRAGLDRLLVVQGGPGTGKTAVGLHRAAFLLYEHRELLEEARLLVVGPNRIFLRYIAQVLPSLGETAVSQTTVEGLAGSRYRVRGEDDQGAAAVKADVRMAAVLQRACRDLLVRPVEDTSLRLAWGRVVLAAAEVGALLDDTLERGLPFAVARDVFRQRLQQVVVTRLRQRFGEDRSHDDDLADDVRTNRDLATLLNRVWPTTSAAALVRRMLGNRAALGRAADGILDPSEQALVRRRVARRLDDEPWTPADLPLLDEAEALVNGPAAAYGHIVVDEAQDLSAMALRMLARRCPSGSMTVLGDLAQATATGSQRRWEDVVEVLGGPAPASIEELDIGYRVPAPILDFAARLLPAAAPNVRPSRSVRTTGDVPSVVRAGDRALLEAVVAETARLAAAWSTVGVVVPASLLADALAALREAGVEHGEGLRVGLDEHVTVLPPPAAKGLEFDAVVVAEPATIVAEEPHGARMLYIAMTRPVQHLSVVHELDLPDALASPRG